HRRRAQGRRARGAAPPGPARHRARGPGRPGGARAAPAQSRRGRSSVSEAAFGRRSLTVSGMEELGAYRLLRVRDPDGPEPQPGQFAMIAAVERWGGGEDERPFLPRAFSIARHEGGESNFLLEDVVPGPRRLCEPQPAAE